ncbi:hypothetical protein [Paracidovorax anthurii]|uniref:hypothetical protein n=1 Tax=Paracidovorax anthurii TaxID=78229 RepID=UPI0011BE7C7B|nr:hypothetical protein [Paracidovorax anthurii]
MDLGWLGVKKSLLAGPQALLAYQKTMFYDRGIVPSSKDLPPDQSLQSRFVVAASGLHARSRHPAETKKPPEGGFSLC